MPDTTPRASAGDGGTRLSHVDAEGRVRMVDVGAKPATRREAVARGSITVAADALLLIREGRIAKGDPLQAARLAGIMAAKRTADLIPLCHPIPLDNISVDLELNEERGGVNITATARTSHKTGVEMEALTAVSVAALTIYDMCKSVDRAMRIQDVRLLRKRGGQSGDIDLE